MWEVKAVLSARLRVWMKGLEEESDVRLGCWMVYECATAAVRRLNPSRQR